MGEMADMMMYDDPFPDEEHRNPPRLITCRCCGKGGLGWIGKQNGRWILGDYETRVKHICPVNPIKETDPPMPDPTNAQITRTLAEKVMGWHRKVVVKGCNPTWHDSAGILKSTDFDDPDDFPWNPCGNRNDLVEVLEKLTPEQWFEVNRSLPTIYSIRSDASPRHGFSWWLLTCDPAIIARAVAEVVSNKENNNENKDSRDSDPEDAD